ncbi:unnamed protein product [Macrosiphum euphorbiae]|uniref:Uncharacterized protein n=1 Tax=Macrosiphum euphorbiae TaxID=13131 RepID=A0AAV0WQ01_9HEMI|nr:unnamed protein product [Macrosiphum euphorbiae]
MVINLTESDREQEEYTSSRLEPRATTSQIRVEVENSMRLEDYKYLLMSGVASVSCKEANIGELPERAD